MGLSRVFGSLVMVLVLFAMTAKADDHNIPPILAPYFDNICNEVNCGKGNCVASTTVPFGFTCQCENGWKRTRLDDEDNLLFLPCVIPNCSLDYSCMPAAPPTPAIPNNISTFDPCYWMYCGEGTCTRNRTYGHTCQCNSGYSNLLDTPAFPCFSECAVGSDCERLGVRISNSSSSSQDGGSQATSFLPGKFHWIAIMLMSGAMAIWN
ncbi:hypothetical protein LguiA_010859 [Lonicera macranthoides]